MPPLPQLVDAYASASGSPAILTFATAGYFHWVRHLQRNLHLLRLHWTCELKVCVPDNVTAALTREENLAPLQLRDVLRGRPRSPSHGASAEDFGSSGYAATVHVKAACIHAFLMLQPEGSLFMFLDADSTLFSSPWPHFPGGGDVDMALLDDSGPTQRGKTAATLNSGCFLLRVCSATRSLWRAMVQMHRLYPTMLDQVALNHLLKKPNEYANAFGRSQPGGRGLARAALGGGGGGGHGERNASAAGGRVRAVALPAGTFLNGYRFYEARGRGFDAAAAARIVVVHHNWIRGDRKKWERASDFDAVTTAADARSGDAGTFMRRALAAMRHKSRWVYNAQGG